MSGGGVDRWAFGEGESYVSLRNFDVMSASSAGISDLRLLASGCAATQGGIIVGSLGLTRWRVSQSW